MATSKYSSEPERRETGLDGRFFVPQVPDLGQVFVKKPLPEAEIPMRYSRACAGDKTIKSRHEVRSKHPQGIWNYELRPR